MKVTNGQIFEAVSSGALTEISKQKLSVKEKLEIARLVNKLKVEFQSIQDTRNNLIVQYGTENPETHQIEVKVGTKEFNQFSRDLTEMMGAEVEIDATPINLPDDLETETDLTPILVFIA